MERQKAFTNPHVRIDCTGTLTARLHQMADQGIKTAGLSMDMRGSALKESIDALHLARRRFPGMELRLISRTGGDLSTRSQHRAFIEAASHADVIGADLHHAPGREANYVVKVLRIADELADKTGQPKPVHLTADNRMPVRNGLQIVLGILKEHRPEYPVTVCGLRTFATYAPTWRDIMANYVNKIGVALVLDPSASRVFNNGWECTQDRAFTDLVKKGVKVALGGSGFQGVKDLNRPRIKRLSDDDKERVLVTNGLKSLGVTEEEYSYDAAAISGIAAG